MENNKLKFRAWDKRFQKYTNDVVSGERDDEGLSPYSEGEITVIDLKALPQPQA